MVRIIQGYQLVEAAGAADGGVQFEHVVGCAHRDDALSAVIAVKAFQKCADDNVCPRGILIWRAIARSEGIDLVHKRDARSHACGLRKEGPHLANDVTRS
jgi:hypothetical protein